MHVDYLAYYFHSDSKSVIQQRIYIYIYINLLKCMNGHEQDGTIVLGSINAKSVRHGPYCVGLRW